MSSKNTIVVKSYNNVRLEKVAAAAITPGHLVELTSAGKVQKHSSAAGNVLPMFAMEDYLQGKLISEDYAAAAPVQVAIPQRGDVIQARLADGESVVIGDQVESAGDGTLQKHVADSSTDIDGAYPLVGIALEALDFSGSSGEDPSSNLFLVLIA